MSDRYDVMHARKGRDGKAYWTRCGVAFPNKAGTGFNITLNYLPAPISGEGYQFAMMPPKPRENDTDAEGRHSHTDAPF